MRSTRRGSAGPFLLTAEEISQLRAVEQAQQSLVFAAVIGGGIELEGRPASIKSNSECIKRAENRRLAPLGDQLKGQV